ncbi:hypothetical protein SmB9_07210 [Sphingosinicella microcystinivorans]|uniref:Polyketide cyclase/dehydrase/lipid transport protein n=1 Tax=Sphingosinicella microcystinivorans TaxID=335406 RepID=A0AAD1D4B6_SPHMI|nr:hypothetical protein SmB9_07210 [Sphingosinicella microcystinivorans]
MDVFEIVRETLLLRSPDQLWEVLADFDRYERWKPYVRPKGLFERGAEIEFSFRMNPANPRFWRVTATISRCDPGEHLAFDVKLGGMLLSIEEHFKIEPAPEGTRLTHSISCKGLIARLGLPKIRRNFEVLLSETNRLLTQYLARPRSKPAAKVMRSKKGRRS